MFIGYWDLETSPPTYDITPFLCALERMRLRRNESQVAIHIVPGPVNGFRKDRLWPHDVETRKLMLEKVAVPMAHMLPSAVEIKVLDKRPARPEPRSIGWRCRLYGLALQVECMREGIRPLRLSADPPKNPKLVTITLREADHWPERNSNLPEWIKAAEWFTKRGLEVIFVRDAVKATEPLEGFETCAAASTDLFARAFLYRSAAVNLFVNNGPAWFALAMDAAAVIFKPTVEGLMSTCNAAYFRRCGLGEGAQILQAATHQRIAWCEDYAENILAGFNTFGEHILAALVERAPSL